MKNLALVILYTLFVTGMCAVTATKDLDPKLLIIFEQLQSDSDKSKLEGKEFEIDLTVKIASDRFLIFSDANLQADGETKYQIGKWIFTPEQITNSKLNMGSDCRVRFKIEKVMTEPPYTDMPHFTAQILSIAALGRQVDPGNGEQ
jgi:hypothetical protein